MIHTRHWKSPRKAGTAFPEALKIDRSRPPVFYEFNHKRELVKVETRV